MTADRVNDLIKAGADVNCDVLKSAVRNGNPAILDALIKAGADVNAKNRFGESILDYAKKRGGNVYRRLKELQPE